ncbi:MAG: HepT-like ribonuclease domain-containing protein [Campylobacterota bacterium]|nr:HepT-like ribonuclease domain-containing protein [Campylobacterota bacterium]
MYSNKKRDIELFIVDIFVAIEKTKEYTQPFSNPNDFQHSSLHWDASMRQLEIIGEALNKLLEDEKFNLLAPSYFRKVVNFRNSIVHGYFGIDLDEVWNIITEKLEILRIDLFIIVKDNINLEEAILCEIEEYKSLNDINIVKYLMQL